MTKKHNENDKIEGMELIIYFKDHFKNNINLDITPTQAEIIFTALGLKMTAQDDGILLNKYTDQYLQKIILPAIKDNLK